MNGVRAGRITIPQHEIGFRFSRSGGAGGQNVNKRDTRVEAIFDVAGSPTLSDEMKRRARTRLGSRLDARGRLHVVASDERTQAANRRAALERLAEVLEKALRPPPKPRRATKPTKGSREKRLAQKSKHGETKRLRRPPRDD